MRKLYELKAAVEGLSKTVTTPDADLDLTVSSSLCTQSISAATFQGTTDLDALLGKVRNLTRHWRLLTMPEEFFSRVFVQIIFLHLLVVTSFE